MMKSDSLEPNVDLVVSFKHLHNTSTAAMATQALPVHRLKAQLLPRVVLIIDHNICIIGLIYFSSIFQKVQKMLWLKVFVEMPLDARKK